MAIARLTRRPRSVVFDLMTAGIIGILAAIPLGPLGTARLGEATLIGLGMAAALLLRRPYPLPVMAVVSALGLIQVLRLPANPGVRPYDLAILIAMYSVVKYSRPLWQAFLAAVPVIIGIVIEVRFAVERNGAANSAVLLSIQGGIFAGGVCAAVWLTGYTMRTRRLYILGLEERAATAERERDHLATIAVAEERASIARDLHDVVAHSMAVMIVQADGASYALDGDLEQARVAIKQVAATGRDALEDMRRLVGVLRGNAPDQAEDRADEAADRRRIGLDQLAALVDRAHSAGLTVTLDEHGDRDRLPAAVELTVYRIVQESLTNVLRHAGPGAQVTLRLRYAAGAIGVEVTDDGGDQRATGAPVTAAGGHGMVGMRERIAVHGGSFEAGPRLGGGWRVAVEVPWT